MPRFIGKTIQGVEFLEVAPLQSPIKLTYAQSTLLPPEKLRKELNTSDKGSRGRKAKRWYNWYADATIIRRAPQSTVKMLERAGGVK